MRGNTIIVSILILAVLLTGAYVLWKDDVVTPGPSHDPITLGWQEFSTSTLGVTFKYPEDFGTQYVQSSDWPPQVQILDSLFSCTEAGAPEMRAGRTEIRTINGQVYCVTEVMEGAAGSVYTQYAYAFPKNNKTVILTFSLRRPQCANYEDAERVDCEDEQGSLSIDKIISQISETLVLNATSTPST